MAHKKISSWRKRRERQRNIQKKNQKKAEMRCKGKRSEAVGRNGMDKRVLMAVDNVLMVVVVTVQGR